MIRDNKKQKFLITIFIVCLVGSLVVNIGQAYAEPPALALKKFEAYGLYTCMRDHFKRSFTQEEVEEDFFNDSTGALMEGSDNDSVSLPAGSDLRGANNYRINCTKLTADLIGANSFNENPYGSFVELLEKFGYEKQNGNVVGGSKCKIYKFQGTQYREDMGLYGSWHDAGAIEYCESSVKADGTINSDSTPTVKVLRGNYLDQTFKDYGWEPLIGYLYKGDSSKVTYCINYQSDWSWGDDCSHYDDEDKISVSRSGSWSTVSAKLDQEIAGLFETQAKDYYDDPNKAVLVDLANGLYIRYNGAVDGSSGSATANSAFEYKITNVLKSFKKAYKNIWDEDFSSNKFSKSQQAGLYQNYVLSYWGAETKACADTKTESTEAGKDLVLGNDNDSYYHQTKLYKSDGSAQYCYARTEKWGNQVYGITDSQVPSNTEIGFAAVTKWLLDNGPDSIDPEDLTTVSSSDDDNGNSSNGEDDPCYNAGVEGMSWILCPTIDNTANAVDGIESVLRGWLQIDTNQIFRSQTYDAWNVFRNIANALIIIVLLMIIFSQLTGVGIDNYGIKKMLPRLVIMAILINLSYIVCELAVDLSNILGVGLNNMFESIGTAIRGGNGAAAETVATIVDALLATLAGAGAAASAVITIVGIAEGGGVMLIISLVLVLLVALVAVLMFFVMLGARMVIVIMFTVIAPVAFACYILPNTQNLFKKWWKVFQAALVIFPICGALYGMSFVIKAIIFGGGDVDFMMALIAVCVPFLPFLLLPTLLRGALAGLGALGGTLTMMGNGLRKGLSSGNTALKNTDRYKNALERNAENRTRFRAGLNRQGKEIEMGRFGRFVRGGDRGVARARMQYVKDQNKRAIEDRMVEPGSAGFEAALISQQKAAEGDMVKDYMTLINSRTNNGENETELGRMLASYVGSGNKMGAVAVARIAGRRKDTASGFLNKYFNDTGEYSSELREALAKEIATGENSANYRESSPFGFEFAAQINKGSKNDDGSPITDYAGWLGHQDANGSYDNVHRAMNNYVTNSKDLVGMKGGALKELARLMREGGIDASDAERLRGVARDAIRNRGTTGVWDSTKEQQIYEIAGLPYPPVDTSAGRRSGGSGGGNVPSGYTQTDSGLIIPH